MIVNVTENMITTERVIMTAIVMIAMIIAENQEFSLHIIMITADAMID